MKKHKPGYYATSNLEYLIVIYPDKSYDQSTCLDDSFSFPPYFNKETQFYENRCGNTRINLKNLHFLGPL